MQALCVGFMPKQTKESSDKHLSTRTEMNATHHVTPQSFSKFPTSFGNYHSLIPNHRDLKDEANFLFDKTKDSRNEYVMIRHIGYEIFIFVKKNIAISSI